METSKSNLKVYFYLKKKNVRDGLCPVMGRISIGKDMVQFSCKLEANPDLWDTRAGRLTGKSDHARLVNREIDKINVAVNASFKEIEAVRGQATANEVKNACQGIALAQETVLKIFREHNETFEKRVGVNRSNRTFWNYKSSYVCFERFIREKYHVSDLSFRQMDYAFIENYDYFMKIDCRWMPNTILQKMTHLRKMVRTAIRRKIISHDPFLGFSAERPKTCQRYVPEDEFEKLMKTPLESSALEVTRDMFVFSCFTGLAYVDLYNLTNQQIIKMDDRSLWININRQKTGSGSNIPLLNISLKIIRKYKGTGCGDKVFPMKTCSVMNGQLKTIAKLCGIERRLTFHMSRHTFATETCLSQGVPLETVCNLMGHKDLITTRIYAKVTHNKMNEDMQALSKTINGEYVLAS